MSLKGVRNIPLFIFYTLAIWACYFLHFYFTFYCFAFTAHLGILAALVMFVGGTFAVIVPTPNGAGPWHFAIISMMMLYGVNVTDAGIFALIVHGIQTFLVVLLGVYGLAALPFTNRHRGVKFYAKKCIFLTCFCQPPLSSENFSITWHCLIIRFKIVLKYLL